MKVFYSIDHDGHYPVGVVSVVIADSMEEAYIFLDHALETAGLSTSKQIPYTLIELDSTITAAYILNNGDY